MEESSREESFMASMSRCFLGENSMKESFMEDKFIEDEDSSIEDSFMEGSPRGVILWECLSGESYEPSDPDFQEELRIKGPQEHSSHIEELYQIGCRSISLASCARSTANLLKVGICPKAPFPKVASTKAPDSSWIVMAIRSQIIRLEPTFYFLKKYFSGW
jgi:hypothetical protein